MAQTSKKTKESKITQDNQIADLKSKYKTLLVVEFPNARSSFIQKLRDDIHNDSKILFGKKKILAKSLAKNNIKLNVTGDSCLIFTNKMDIAEYLNKIDIKSFLRTNDISAYEFVLNSGIIKIDNKDINVDMGTKLRDLGLPCEIKNGKVWLNNDYVVIKKDEKVNDKQAKILKMFGLEYACLSVKIIDSVNL